MPLITSLLGGTPSAVRQHAGYRRVGVLMKLFQLAGTRDGAREYILIDVVERQRCSEHQEEDKGEDELQ